MAAGNNVTVVGNATRDPELRFTPSGQAVATFGLAVNRRWQNRQTSEWEEAVSFFDVTCWAQMAENVDESRALYKLVKQQGRDGAAGIVQGERALARIEHSERGSVKRDAEKPAGEVSES
jgi:single-stranded DNA-binding protein